MLRTAADLDRQTEILRRQLGPEHPLTKQTERAVHTLNYMRSSGRMPRTSMPLRKV